jgi:hypothetical protein
MIIWREESSPGLAVSLPPFGKGAPDTKPMATGSRAFTGDDEALPGFGFAGLRPVRLSIPRHRWS